MHLILQLTSLGTVVSPLDFPRKMLGCQYGNKTRARARAEPLRTLVALTTAIYRELRAIVKPRCVSPRALARADPNNEYGCTCERAAGMWRFMIKGDLTYDDDRHRASRNAAEVVAFRAKWTSYRESASALSTPSKFELSDGYR